MRERRRVRRTQVFKSAKITMNGSYRDCIVRDISSLGARLAFVSTAYIPENFSLTFDAARTLRTCRVAWRSSTEVGVEFQEGSFHSAA
jgi:PilZ domain-containing protein